MAAAEIEARAYTSGRHVVLEQGETDKHTLAHELTHVIQQVPTAMRGLPPAVLAGSAGDAAAPEVVDKPVQSSAVHEVLRSTGRPLDEPVRAEMEARLGTDFSDVRVHTDAAARVAAAEVGARAYTSGNHVVIGGGGADRHTLAHELTHVIQQHTGPVAGTDHGGGLRVSDPSDRFEREAEANARRVMAAPTTSGPTALHGSEPAAARVGTEDTIQRTDFSKQPEGGTDSYTTEQFTYGGELRQRASIAKVYVRAAKSRGATPPPLSFIAPSGEVDGDIGWQRGHVVALEAGGVNDSKNIVPMRPGFNHGPAWRNVERKARERGEEFGRGHVQFEVKLVYPQPGGAEDGRVPESIGYALRQNTEGSWKEIEDGTLEHKANETPPAGDDMKKTLTSRPPAALAFNRFEDSAENSDKSKALVEGNHMPIAKKAEWPDHPKDRPYENLDLQWLDDKLSYPGTIVSNTDFTPEQRRLILQANMARHDNQLCSDDPRDPHRRLDENGTANYPEIDHIIPKSVGGSNAYSNAQVISWELNNVRARVKSIHELVDTKRLPLPTTKDLGEQIWQAVLRLPAEPNPEPNRKRKRGAELKISQGKDTDESNIIAFICEKYGNTSAKRVVCELDTLVSAGYLYRSGDSGDNYEIGKDIKERRRSGAGLDPSGSHSLAWPGS